jgi:ubiquinone/menaquinone biosynthesis C-methylase UbiE
MKKEYVLREVDHDEISRLDFQHQVWKKETNFAIKKAGIKKGDKIIDLGSGPGYLSYDLSVLTGLKGKIYCLDNSDKFIDFINNKKIKNIKAIKTDIRTGFSNSSRNPEINKVFCRWVLMFVGDVEKIIRDVYNLLSIGGKFISIEYFNFGQINMFPNSIHFNRIYKNVQKLLINNGGDPSIGNKIYKIMHSKGFKNIKVYPIYRTGKANSPLWKWLENTNQNHKNLVENNLITNRELELYLEDWNQKSKLKYPFITAPPLMITIGEK